MTMIVVTHEMGFAEEVAAEVVFMVDGAASGTRPPSQGRAAPQHERPRQFPARVL